MGSHVQDPNSQAQPRQEEVKQFKMPIFPPLGKRVTRKPAKFLSPFKKGTWTRTPPNMETALTMRAFLCAEDSVLKKRTVMKFGMLPLTGEYIAKSFGDSTYTDNLFIQGFVKCISYDDKYIRSECYGHRLFLDPDLSAYLNVEWLKRKQPHPEYDEEETVAALKKCLPDCNLKKIKMIFLPVLHNDHWSVYCINLAQDRIDILDSLQYGSNMGRCTFGDHHDVMGKRIMERLSNAFSKAAPRKIKSFKNWRPVEVKVPKQNSTNDCAFFAMKFLEYY